MTRDDQIVAEVVTGLQQKGWVLPATDEQYQRLVRDGILALIAAASRPGSFKRLAIAFGVEVPHGNH